MGLIQIMYRELPEAGASLAAAQAQEE